MLSSPPDEHHDARAEVLPATSPTRTLPRGVAERTEHLGGCHIVVTNAGVGEKLTWEEVDLDACWTSTSLERIVPCYLTTGQHRTTERPQPLDPSSG